MTMCRPLPSLSASRRALLAAWHVASLAAAILLAAPLRAQEHAGHGDDALGEVVFPISCGATATRHFTTAVALLHSFGYERAHAAFRAAAQAEPGCAMAYWGEAMARVEQLWDPPGREALREGKEAVRRALEVGAPTQRERDYIDAIAAFYAGEGVTFPERLGRYAERMRVVAERHGARDPEARIWYALALLATTSPSDTTYARQREAAAILEPLFREQPRHPGLAHYIIHAYDSAKLAHLGLDAARRYAAIAPGTGHALHMPSHIFTRLGMWDESVASNLDAERRVRVNTHSGDYILYAYLQQGRDAEARKIVERTGPPREGESALIAARWPIERGAWAEAARLPAPPEGAANVAAAILRFARGLGAARGGEVALAKRELEALGRIRDALRARGAREFRVAEATTQYLAASAWVALAEGRVEDALRLAEEAGELEDRTEEESLTAGRLIPARELQGDLLLALGRPAEALRAYEAALRAAPNRARSLYGAAVSAERAGDVPVARRHYEALARLMSKADADRPEARAAREYLRQ
jgi:tetratricopeptide (TPR) repeat protein